MKIAVLILAHKNLEQLRLLVDHLKTDFEVYIHFDKRTKHNFVNEGQVHIIKNRVSAYWGSAGAIKAMLELISVANADACDYYLFVSGQDLPLMSNEAITKHIGQGETNYVYHHSLPYQGWSNNGGLDRLTLYWDIKYDSNKLIFRLMALLSKVAFYLFRKLQIFSKLKRKLYFQPYGGSMWLNLNNAAVNYILNFVAANPKFVDRFRYTRATDEVFFHSILFGFGYPGKEKIINDDMRYIDWEKGPEYPKVFTYEDYDRCINSGKFFGRKFDDQKDETVIHKILKHVSGT